MNKSTGTAIAAACVLATVAPAAAQPQVAVVQDVSSKTAGVEFMDYVAVGRQIRLGPRDTIVLEYMQSCWRETITGGQVTIGTELSDVNAGQVERHKVDCDGGRLMLTSTLASQSAGLVVRAMRPQGQGTPPAPQITLYGLSPLVELKGGGKLVIERVDQPGERYEYAVGGEQLLKGAFFDLARVGQALAPGGTYRASVGPRQIVFKIDPGAKPGASPVVGRLLRLAT
jgi:hypothetical protein